MNKPTIADVLHRAADEFLAKDYQEFLDTDDKQRFSCIAVKYSIEAFEDEKIISAQECNKLGNKIFKYLANMGLDVNSSTQFTVIAGECSEYTQGARYNWLKFAAMIAEEECV